MASKLSGEEHKKIEVQVPAEMRKGVYANTISVTGTNSEISVNFIYNNPADDPAGTLVSRVIIPISFAKKVADILSKVAKQIEEKEKKT